MYKNFNCYNYFNSQWEQLMEMGSKEPDTQLDNVLKTIAVNECCTLVYTVCIKSFFYFI